MSGTTVIELELPLVPPSLNAVGSRGNAVGAWRRWQDEKAKWELVLAAKLGWSPAPAWRLARCSAHLRFPTRRRRDEGNFRVLLEKALGDALVKRLWLPDDDHQRYRFERVHFDPLTGPERTLVVVELYPEEP